MGAMNSEHPSPAERAAVDVWQAVGRLERFQTEMLGENADLIADAHRKLGALLKRVEKVHDR